MFHVANHRACECECDVDFWPTGEIAPSGQKSCLSWHTIIMQLCPSGIYVLEAAKIRLMMTLDGNAQMIKAVACVVRLSASSSYLIASFISRATLYMLQLLCI